MLVKHLKNLNNCENAVRLESKNITTQPGEIDDRKFEVIGLVLNTGLNVTAIAFYIQIQERSFFVLTVWFLQLKF